MKLNKKSVIDFIKTNIWFIIGFILITIFVFSNYLYDYKLSFTNINYTFEPYNTYGVKTDGPLLSDIADSEYPLIYKIFYSNTGFSLWDSDLALGSTSNAIAEIINPMKWVYVLPFDIAVFLKSLSEFAIAFFSMFLFMRTLNVKKYPAAICGIIYTFSSVIVAWNGWAHSDVAACAPLLFFAIEKLISTIKIKYALLITLVIYIMLIVGMPTYAAYFLYLAGIYIVLFTVIRHWRNKRNIIIIGCMFAFSVILAALLSLPYTYTLLDSVVANGYADSRAAQAKAILDWDYLRTFIYPNLRNNLSIHINESTLFVGLITIILLPFSICNIKNKNKNLFFIISSLVIFALIFTDIFDFIYTKLPLINTSLKFRVITLLMFTLSVITGITLNDLINNKAYYRQKKWLLAVMTAWTSCIIFIASKDLFSVEKETVTDVLFLSLGLIFCIFLIVIIKKNYKLILVLFAILIVLDSTQLVKEYMPWIDANADMIPAPSDSVTYLMENTDEQERIVGIGEWTLFPNTPSYYELNDIRVHGFISTNLDLVNYFTEIDETAYASRTRTSIDTIQNYPLLKYLGVKYIYGSNLSNNIAINNTEGVLNTLGTIPDYSTISQDIYLNKNTKMIQIRCATYGSIPTSNGSINLNIVEKNSGQAVLNKDFPVCDIRDNSYITASFDENIILEDSLYTLTLSFGNLENDTITVWTQSTTNSTVYFNEVLPELSLVINTIQDSDEYEIAHIGTDSIMVAELSEYSDKAELIENAYLCADEEDILNKMKAEYIDNTAFITNENSFTEYSIPLTANEGIQVLEYADDYIKLSCTSEYERYVMLNDYYNDDWAAYINGEKTEIEKVNYLMRAVKVSQGEDMIIEFKYEPTKLYTVTICSAIVLLVSILFFLFRNKLQILLDKKIILS